jgi:hypothetical protein
MAASSQYSTFQKAIAAELQRNDSEAGHKIRATFQIAGVRFRVRTPYSPVKLSQGKEVAYPWPQCKLSGGGNRRKES